MTPDEARALLDGTTPAEDWWHTVKGGWVRHLEPVGIDSAGELDVSEDDAALIVAAPTLAAMIADMHEEWGVHVTGYPKNIADWAEICDGPADSTAWFADEEAAEAFATEREDDGYDTRLTRRYVTEPEVCE